MLIALVFAGGMNVWAYWFSDKMVLRMAGAPGRRRELALPLQHGERAGQPCRLPMPRSSPHRRGSAERPFATGRNPEHAAVAATTGIMQMLSERELRGRDGPRTAHAKNRDILIFDDLRDRGPAISMLAHFGMFFGGRAMARIAPTPSSRSRSSILAPPGMLIRWRYRRTRGLVPTAAARRSRIPPRSRARRSMPTRAASRCTADAPRNGADDVIMNPFRWRSEEGPARIPALHRGVCGRRRWRSAHVDGLGDGGAGVIADGRHIAIRPAAPARSVVLASKRVLATQPRQAVRSPRTCRR